MEIIGVIGFLVVIAAIWWIFNKATSAAGNAVNRTVHRKDVRRENELWNRTWGWSTTAPWCEVRSALDTEIAKMSTQFPGLRVVGEDDNAVRVGFTFEGTPGAALKYGVLEVKNYEFQADLVHLDDRVTFEFAQVKNVNGAARCVSEMEQFLAAVERAVKTVDPTASEISA
ncbi:MAG: hypothetical protein FWE61_02495 [Micrococcales bacterium]|nr:hypothetical protein [Micrococcales bacterium]